MEFFVGLRNALVFLGILIPLVTLHEMGHFFAAKAFGIKVLEFGLGFPPRIKGLVWKKGETEYTVNWLPIGGFVRLLGEEDPEDPRSLAAAARWKRLTVMFAGVFMNLVLAVVLLSIGFMIPRERSLTLAQIAEVSPGSPAANATIEGEMRDGSQPLQGIQPGDIIRSIEGRDVKNVSEASYYVRRYLGDTQTWEINRANSTLIAQVGSRWDPPPGQGPTGVRLGAPQTCTVNDAGDPVCQFLYPYTEEVSSPPWEAVPEAMQSIWDTVILTKNEIQIRLAQAFSDSGDGASIGGDGPAFQGPVGIATTTGDIIDEAGWRSLVQLAALLSLNLAIFNALPLPMLDGGRMFFVLIEILRGGRRIAPEKEALVHLTGFALMMAGVLVVTYFDIARIVS